MHFCVQMQRMGTAAAWKRAYTLESDTEFFLALATPQLADKSSDAAVEWSHCQRHVLAACTNKRVMLFHAADATRALLVTQLPLAMPDPMALHVEVPAQPARPAATPAHIAAKRSEGVEGAAGSGVQECALGGIVFVTCRRTGLTAVFSFALHPALFGLALAAVEPAAVGTQLSDGSSGGCAAHTVLDVVPAFTADSRTPSGPARYSKRPRSPQTAAHSWVLTSSTASTWLGPLQVIGCPLKCLALQNGPALDDLLTVQGGQAPEPVRTSLIAMLQHCIDNCGASIACGAAEASHELGSSGANDTSRHHTGGCFAELRARLSTVKVVRGDLHGCPILQRFAWHPPSDSPQRWGQVTVHACQSACSTVRPHSTPPVAGRKAVQSTMRSHAWRAPQQMCTAQLCQFASTWCGRLDAPSSTWAATRQQDDSAGAGMPECEHAALPWPFQHSRLPDSGGARMEAVQRRAVAAVLKHLDTVSTIADVWAAAAMLAVGCAAASAPDGHRIGPSNCGSQGACGSCSNEQAQQAVALPPLATVAAPACWSEMLSKRAGALRPAEPCEPFTRRGICGAVNAFNVGAKCPTGARPESAHCLLAWPGAPRQEVVQDARTNGAHGAPAEGACAACSDPLCCVLAVLRDLGPSAPLHLEPVLVPAWHWELDLHGSGSTQRRRQSSSGAGTAWARSGFDWLVVPHSNVDATAAAKRKRGKVGRFQASVGAALVDRMGDNVEETLETLAERWNTRP